MSAAHTPGPWVVNPFVAQVDCTTLSVQGGLLPVCRMLWPTDERSEDETEANGHLIATSPRLYTFVERVRDELLASDDPKTAGLLGAADALLKEARGEQVPE